VYEARFAIDTVSRVSVSVPIWLTFTRIELATPSRMPRLRRSTLVTKRSSPTICTRSPRARVSEAQPSQSSSAMPSSIETIGYLSHRSTQKATNPSESSSASLARQDVAAVAVDLTRRRIEANGDVVARHVPGGALSPRPAP